MTPKLLRGLSIGLMMIGAAVLLTSCGGGMDTRNKMIISARDQRMLLLRDGKPVRSYRVSTSKYGLGSRAGSKQTPLSESHIGYI